MKTLLTLDNRTIEISKGKYSLWYMDDGSDVEIYFEEIQNGVWEFAGILIDNLSQKKIDELMKDCEMEKGFFNPLADLGSIEDFANIFKIE